MDTQASFMVNCMLLALQKVRLNAKNLNNNNDNNYTSFTNISSALNFTVDSHSIEPYNITLQSNDQNNYQ